MSGVLDTIHAYWKPHTGQKEVLKEIMGNDKEMIYVECGRKWGKTEFGVYLCWLFALSNPRSHIYYYGPQDDQTKELVWANDRMQTCNTYDLEFVESMQSLFGGELKIRDSEMRIVFPNGSFIRCDGSNNYNAHRGLQPDLVVCDEYRDFKGEWFEAYKPNLLARGGKILFITTPQSWYNHSQQLADYCKKSEFGEAYYLNQPSIKNDMIPGHIKWLEREEKLLLDAGKFDVWKREYEAAFISGGQSSLIPQLNRGCMKDHLEVMNYLDNEQVEFSIGVTTGLGSGHYAVVLAHVPRTAKIYVLDAYKTEERVKTTVSNLASELLSMAYHIRPFCDISNDWDIVYSYSDTRLMQSLADKCDIEGTTASREPEKVPYMLDEIREMVAKNELVFSERAIDVIEENELTSNRPDMSKSIIRESKGMIPLLSCIKQCMEHSNFSFKKRSKPKVKNEAEEWEEKVSKAMSFDQWARKIRMEKYGIGYDEDPFSEELEFWKTGEEDEFNHNFSNM